jgi:hypothetical protein
VAAIFELAETAKCLIAEFIESIQQWLIVRYILLIPHQAIIAREVTQAEGVPPYAVETPSHEDVRWIGSPLTNVYALDARPPR